MIFSICLIMPEMMYMKWGSEFSEIASFTRPPVVYCSSSRNLYDHRHTHGAELCFLCGDQTRELFQYNRAIAGSFQKCETLPHSTFNLQCIHKAQLQERELSSHLSMPWIFTTAREVSQVQLPYQSCTVSARRQYATSGLVERGRRRHGIWTSLERSRSRRWGGRWDAKTRNQGSQGSCVQSLSPSLGLKGPPIYLPNHNPPT